MKQSSSYRRHLHLSGEDQTSVMHQEEMANQFMMEMEEDHLGSEICKSSASITVIETRQPAGRSARVQLFAQIVLLVFLIEGFHRFISHGHFGGASSRDNMGRTAGEADSALDGGIDSFLWVNASKRKVPQNDTCIIVSCHTYDAPGLSYFIHHYQSKFNYSLHLTQFESILYGKEEEAHPNWCRIQVVLDAIRSFPSSRIVYTDVNTRIDPGVWCNMPHLGLSSAPIIMNTGWRSATEITEHWYAQGNQVRTDTFVVAAGAVGAVKRWESLYRPRIALMDQGVLHAEEQGRLCGIPGWIACYNSPEQKKCSCSAQNKDRESMTKCMHHLFVEMENCPKDKTERPGLPTR